MLYHAGTHTAELREIGFRTEKDMQKFCEGNMDALLGLRMVASEFRVGQFRFDSVAYQAESNAFIVIEYKNDQNFSVIDQGYSYIATLLNHKADFVLKFNQVFGVSKGLVDFDWTQVRVLFVAPRYTTYQINSINFGDLPMELWKIKRYEQDIIQFEQIRPTSTSASISGYLAKEGKGQTGASSPEQEVVVYTEENRLADGSDASRELYAEFRDYILSLRRRHQSEGDEDVHRFPIEPTQSGRYQAAKGFDYHVAELSVWSFG